MADRKRVYKLLRRIPQNGLATVKELFWTELNYERANQVLSFRNWPDRAKEALSTPPILLAQHGDFAVIHGTLSEEQRGVNSPLSLIAERLVINQLKRNHPYAIFLFSSADGSGQEHWHMVNVRYEAEEERRRVFRRITIGPGERLRTASERIAMLDLATIHRDLIGLSPLAIQQRHDDAFDVEAVTRDFFRDYRIVFEGTEAAIEGISDLESRRLFTQTLFNRMMFIIFLERKGWLAFEGNASEYLRTLWNAHRQEVNNDPSYNFYRDRLKLLFFSGLSTTSEVNNIGIQPDGFLQTRIGTMPYLNGGLFEEDLLDADSNIIVPDSVIGTAINNLFYRYNFTVTESTPLDIEVAVDPEMLGKIFEELVTGRHETGSYYTPKPVVSFMAHEVLKGYLGTACPQESDLAITKFVKDQDPVHIRNPEAVLEALRNVTICDLACGSGAYLLGMLRELFDLRASLFAVSGLDSLTAYQRKLEIIQKNIYGVDIDPFAINIARLRLWLSLMVDFEGDNPPPLPNLDFKLEVGDSVTGPDPSGGLMTDIFRQQEIEKFLLLKTEYMSTHGSEKVSMRKQIEEQRRNIAEWTPIKNEELGFDWVVEFAEVFGSVNEGGGFDIVLTNPPYVRQELIRDIKPVLKRLYGELYLGTADLYVFFYYRALQMLKKGGVLCFISSNKWMRARYGQRLRCHLIEQIALQTVVDFGDLPIFTATTYPCIVLGRKGPASDQHTFRALVVDDIAAVERVANEVKSSGWNQFQSSLRADSWALVQPEVLDLMEKLRRGGKPLVEIVQRQFYRGVLTGFNKAFIIDESTRARLISQDPQSARIIKPWLRGRDIKRWSVKRSGLHVIFTRRGIQIDDYPVIKAHLSQYKKRLMPGTKSGRKPGTYQWYEIQDIIAYHAEFEKSKIVWPDIAKRPEFSYDRSGAFGGNTMYIMPTDELYLLGLLNSRLMEFYYRHISSTIRGDYLRFIATYIRQLPISKPDPDQRTAVVTIVKRLLVLRGQGEESVQLETELNNLVYQFYDLQSEEIALIEEELYAGERHIRIKKASDALSKLLEE